MSKQQDLWPVPDTLKEARALYAELEEQKGWADRQARDEGRSKEWARKAGGLYDLIVVAQERLVARYGEAVKRASRREREP